MPIGVIVNALSVAVGGALGKSAEGQAYRVISEKT